MSREIIQWKKIKDAKEKAKVKDLIEQKIRTLAGEHLVLCTELELELLGEEATGLCESNPHDSL